MKYKVELGDQICNYKKKVATPRNKVTMWNIKLQLLKTKSQLWNIKSNYKDIKEYNNNNYLLSSHGSSGFSVEDLDFP